MMASQRHPPVSTNTSRELRDASEPERDPIRMTHAVIDAGRSDSTMKPSTSQANPATSHSHQVRA